jgi:teichoic acid transport system ATP-binding protein
MGVAEARTADGASPTVVVEDLHVVYRVHGSGDKGTATSALVRALKRQRRPAVREIHAVRGVNLVARRGDAIGVIGRNGSGKSSLLRAIAGLLPPDRGRVFTEGQPSLLGVNAALVTDLTGERNVILGCLAMGMTPEEVREKYDEIVEFSGIGDFIELPMRTYSSGMAARLRFAIAAAKAHEVLLIDEALATGDREFRRRSRQRMHELREEAGTVFLVSHSLDVIAETCNRAVWLEQGRIQAQGDAESVIAAYSAAE